MTTPVFANSGSIQPVQGREVSCCSVAGPLAAIDAYISAGSSGLQLEFRLYAIVGTLRTLVATATYAGPPGGASAQGTVLKWTVIDQPAPTNPAIAGGTQYDLTVFGVTGSGTPIFATLAGTNAYDADVAHSAAVAFPTNFGSTTVTTNVGCAQLCDVGVDERGAVQVALDIFVSCGGGSVEALVTSGQTGGTDGLTDVLRQVPLPVGTQYRLAIRNIGIPGTGTIAASLSSYSAIIASSTGGPILNGDVIGPANANTVIKWDNVPLDLVSMAGAALKDGGGAEYIASSGKWTSATRFPVANIMDFGAIAGSDIGPAVQLALNKIAATEGGTLYIPRCPGGGNWIWQTPAIIDFLSTATSLVIQGDSGATQILVQGAPYGPGPIFGPALLQISNVQSSIVIRDIVFVGNPAGGQTPDCAQIIYLAGNLAPSLKNVHFWGIVCDSPTGLVSVNSCGFTSFEDTYFVGCAGVFFTPSVSANVGGVVHVDQPESGVNFVRARWIDTAFLHGVNYSRSAFNNAWVWIGTPAHTPPIGAGESVEFHQCFFDESCLYQVAIVPVGGKIVERVVFRGCGRNIPGTDQGIFSAGIYANGVRTLVIEDETCAFVIAGVQPAGVDSYYFENISRVFIRRCGFYNNAGPFQFNTGVSVVELEAVNGYTLDFGAGKPGVLIVDGQTTNYQPTWAIDPSNSTGLASDSNSGIDPTAPLLTFNEGVLGKWRTNAPFIPQDTSITWLSNTLAGGGDPVILKPTLSNAVLICEGPLGAAQLLHSGILAGCVVKNRGTGQLLNATLGFAAPIGSLIQNTTVGKHSFAWVYKNVVGTTFAISQPMTPVTPPLGLSGAAALAEVDTWSNGDTFEVWAPVEVNFVELAPTITEYKGPDFPAQIQIYHLVGTSVEIAPDFDNLFITDDVTSVESRYDSFVCDSSGADTEMTYYANTFFTFGVFNTAAADGLTGVLAGVMLCTSPSISGWYFDYDVILDSILGLTVGVAKEAVGTFPPTFGLAYIDGQIDASGTTQFSATGTLSAQCVLWGPGLLNGIGSGRISYPAGAGGAAATFKNTGGLNLNSQTSANAFTPATGAWSGPITITAAHLDTAIGGFAGLAVNVGGASFTNQGTV